MSDTFTYSVARNVSGEQGKAFTEVVKADNVDEADKLIQGKYPNHLIYLEGFTKGD